ncbi:MAG: DNA cytosine methyltransferase [Pseudomonadota bacterium]
MKELSLFSGAGGGLLGSKLLNWRHCGYVEYNEYCQKIIKQRIKDGLLENAPIFGDIKTFIDEGYADSYKGLVDVVTAGFPCQPFSVSGKQKTTKDERNMWPETIEVIRRVQPSIAYLENVPGLISTGYIMQVINDLFESGYEVLPPLKIGAGDVGAWHQRKRIWILAYRNSSISE